MFIHFYGDSALSMVAENVKIENFEHELELKKLEIEQDASLKEKE